MSYGIKSFGPDGYLNLHSDYSSIVYAGEMTKNAEPAQPTYAAEHAITITPQMKRGNYGQGWTIQYTIDLDVDYMIPFYKPAFDGQKIAIMDIINEGTTWVVNLLYDGYASQYPAVYAFAPLTELPSVQLNDYGIAVYDANSDIVFTDNMRPLKVDDTVLVQHDTTIRTTGKGSCGNDDSCHVDFNPDNPTTVTGNTANTKNKLYHIVPSAYGGLAFKNSWSGTLHCGFLGWGDRPVQWDYYSWSSFRGVVSHPRGASDHVTDYLGDFSGALHQYVQGDCGVSGLVGALIGIAGALLTGGLSLTMGSFIGGALGGFALAELTRPSQPSLKAYEEDETFDTANPVTMLITDGSYYGIPEHVDIDLIDLVTWEYERTGNPWAGGNWTHWATYSILQNDGSYLPADSFIWYDSGMVAAGMGFNGTSVEVGSTIYFRGDLVSTGPTGTQYQYNFYKVGKI